VKRNRKLTSLAAKVFVELRANSVDHRRVATLEHAFHRATHALELRVEQPAI
jgi:uncharacterized protein YijF (DUF1287 family)